MKSTPWGFGICLGISFAESSWLNYARAPLELLLGLGRSVGLWAWAIIGLWMVWSAIICQTPPWNWAIAMVVFWSLLRHRDDWSRFSAAKSSWKCGVLWRSAIYRWSFQLQTSIYSVQWFSIEMFDFRRVLHNLQCLTGEWWLLESINHWLVVWNILYIPYIGKNNPNWRTHIF